MSDETALGALLRLEEEALAEYCAEVEISGVIAQSVRLKLRRGQSLWASHGSILCYDEGIEWTLRVPGGLGKAVSRAFAGEGIALVHIEAHREGAEVVLTANQPGRLATWDLSRGPIVCTRGSFVAALGDVDIDVTVARRAGAALFGGAGLFMQRLSGRGIVFVHGAGDFVEKQLAAGEKVLVSTGNLALFSAGVDYDVRGVGGCRKVLFGGEGLFMTELTGPGWVMMQTLKKLPPARQGRRGGHAT
ncbi:MAG: AIM24 family protein [Deltaproteobacteria bacterium]|nr:MAG: AIM24 family protein [Deltaproteobacteria bacterium]